MFYSCWLTITNSNKILDFFKVLSNICPTVDLVSYTRKSNSSLIDTFSSFSSQVYFGLWEIGANLTFIHGFFCLWSKYVSIDVRNFWKSKLLWVLEELIHFSKYFKSLFFLFYSQTLPAIGLTSFLIFQLVLLLFSCDIYSHLKGLLLS